MSRPPSPSCLDCGNALPIVFGRTSQHVECLHCEAAFVVRAYGPDRIEVTRAARQFERGPLFHVRFIENGIEQEQIFRGAPDNNGYFNINLPAPCTLLSVKQHRFPFCEVCDVGPNMELLPRKPLIETESMPGTPFERLHGFFESSAVTPEDRAAFICAEVEAMDWPEVIGE